MATRIPREFDQWHPWDDRCRARHRAGPGRRGARPRGRSAHQQFRRRVGQHQREPGHLRQQPRLHRLRAQHQPFDQLLADRRQGRRHAARLLVQHGAERGRPGAAPQRRPARGRAHRRAAGAATDQHRRVSGAVRAGDGAQPGRPPARRGFRRRAVPARQLPARFGGHAVVPGLVLHRRRSVPAARLPFGRVRRRGRGHARAGPGARRRAAALRARQLFGAQARPAAPPPTPAACTTCRSPAMPATARSWFAAWAPACWSPN